MSIIKLATPLPNLKRAFLPDVGFTLADVDYKAADATIVAWESNEDEFKTILREGVDVYSEYKGMLSCDRQGAKMAVHLTDYAGYPGTLAKAIGCTVHAAETFQRSWFGRFPGIKDWHRRVEDALETSRTIRNIYGYEIQYFGRVESLLSEALAWIPQSTVALLVSKAILNLEPYEPVIRFSHQVHDSGDFQFPSTQTQDCLIALHRGFDILIPYDDPLTLKTDLKMSSRSWGECVKMEWPVDDGRCLNHLKSDYYLRSIV